MATPVTENDPVLFILSLFFLLGVLLCATSILPVLRSRFPRLMLTGFLLAVGAVIMVLVIGIVRS